MRTPATVTSLELTDPAAIRPPSRPAPAGLRLTAVHDPAINHRLYVTIGADFRWTDRLTWTAPGWAAHAAAVQTVVASVGGSEAGFYELAPDATGIEIAILGVLAHARGRGLGAHLVADALHRALARAPRVWVHTCTDDGPHALDNYRARGLRVFGARGQTPARAGSAVPVAPRAGERRR